MILTKYIRSFLSKKSGSRLTEKIVQICHQIIQAAENGSNHDIVTNGELRSYLDAVEGVGNDLVVFDVGANVGDWTQTILESEKKRISIHLFEIVPDTFVKLSERINAKEVYLNNFGLSDNPGTVDIHYYPSSDTGSSIVRLPWRVEDKIMKCKVTTGDLYCEERDINTIHFLKIDAEGMDYKILKGFIRMLENKSIQTIQFEVNKTGILTKSFLIDFYNFLSPFGYEIGRVYPYGTKFKSYELFKDEMMIQGNYIARLKYNNESS